MDASASGPLILIVDDNEDSRGMYACHFEAEGCRVEEASHGFEGLDKAFKLRPDVILMDLLMPALDGWETIRLLRNRPQTRHIPIIAVTGDTKLEDLKLARNAGCDRVLVKPCPADVVLNEIWRLLGAGAPGGGH
jgi:two-component system cell cycle response regulator DivK